MKTIKRLFIWMIIFTTIIQLSCTKEGLKSTAYLNNFDTEEKLNEFVLNAGEISIGDPTNEYTIYQSLNIFG